MRHIPIDQLCRVADLTSIGAARDAVNSANDNERSAVMHAHEDAYRQLRSALWQVGHLKCWYSEAILLEGEGHVEHYRPQRRLWGTSHPGYWWCAFDWRNLRLAHPCVNLRMTDYLTKKKAGKGSYFPLRDEAQRATCEAEQQREEPVLLDPAKKSDTQLVVFSPDSGAPMPRYSAERNSWLNRRASETIDYYHLNEGTWNKARFDLMQAVSVLCDRVAEISIQEPRDDEKFHQLVDELAVYISPYSPFSSACLQVVRERGFLEHVGECAA